MGKRKTGQSENSSNIWIRGRREGREAEKTGVGKDSY
jgi:hypothetical protein